MKRKKESSPHVFTIEERERLALHEEKLYKVFGWITLVIGFAGGVPALILLGKSDQGSGSSPVWLGYVILFAALVIVFIGSSLLTKVERVKRRLLFEKNDILLKAVADGGHEYYYVRCASDRFEALFLDRTAGVFGVRTGSAVTWEAPLAAYDSYAIWENGTDRTNVILSAHPIAVGDTSDDVHLVIRFHDLPDRVIPLTSAEQIIPMNHSAYQVVLTELRDLVAILDDIASPAQPE